jgi:hypothetical protein
MRGALMLAWASSLVPRGVAAQEDARALVVALEAGPAFAFPGLAPMVNASVVGRLTPSFGIGGTVQRGAHGHELRESANYELQEQCRRGAHCLYARWALGPTFELRYPAQGVIGTSVRLSPMLALRDDEYGPNHLGFVVMSDASIDLRPGRAEFGPFVAPTLASDGAPFDLLVGLRLAIAFGQPY